MEHDTHDAAYAERHAAAIVRCRLCPHTCLLRPQKRGICLTRGNADGRLVSYNYGRPVTIAVDPIERLPLYHFRPGTEVLSMGPSGCTLKCVFCRSCDIAQNEQPAKRIPLDGLVEAAKRKRARGIAYTCTEPTIWYETIMDIAPQARERGLFNVMTTNGYIEPKPLRDLLQVISAMNIDIKSMNPHFYHRLCKGRLLPVLRACEQTLAAWCHLEVSYLLIPGENDSDGELRELTRFVAEHLGRDVPLHIIRYFPHHRMSHEPTPSETLNRAYEAARERLDYVYVGNVPATARSDTICPTCGELLVSRSGDSATVLGACSKAADGYSTCLLCGTKVKVRQISK